MWIRSSASVRSADPEVVKLFLDIDNRLGTVELLLQLRNLATELCIFECERIGLDPALFRSESIQDAVSALTTPRGEMRRVQSFPANQCATLGRGCARVRFVQDALLVFSGELAVLGFRSDLWVR